MFTIMSAIAPPSGMAWNSRKCPNALARLRLSGILGASTFFLLVFFLPFVLLFFLPVSGRRFIWSVILLTSERGRSAPILKDKAACQYTKYSIASEESGLPVDFLKV